MNNLHYNLHVTCDVNEMLTISYVDPTLYWLLFPRFRFPQIYIVYNTIVNAVFCKYTIYFAIMYVTAYLPSNVTCPANYAETSRKFKFGVFRS